MLTKIYIRTICFGGLLVFCGNAVAYYYNDMPFVPCSNYPYYNCAGAEYSNGIAPYTSYQPIFVPVPVVPVAPMEPVAYPRPGYYQEEGYPNEDHPEYPPEYNQPGNRY